LPGLVRAGREQHDGQLETFDVPNGEYEVSFHVRRSLHLGNSIVSRSKAASRSPMCTPSAARTSARTNVPILRARPPADRDARRQRPDHQHQALLHRSARRRQSVARPDAEAPATSTVPLSSVPSTATGLEVGGRPFRGRASFAIALAEPSSATVTVRTTCAAGGWPRCTKDPLAAGPHPK
jgi:hypothetical protein